MDRKLRYIFAISLLLALIVPVFNVYYLYPKLRDIMVSISADEAREVANHLNIMIFPEKSLSITDADKAELLIARENFNLEKIKVYSSDGTTVFSTSPSDVGSFFGHEYFDAKVKKGELVTNLVKAGEFSLEGELFESDVVETYIPVMDGEMFVGAVETYYDISRSFSSMRSIMRTSTTIVVTAMGVFSVIIFILIMKANNTLIMLQRAEAEAESASRAKGDFLAHMSHEIRTPMNAILGLSDILLGDALSDKQHDEVSMLKFSANNLLAVINDILDISKIEAGKLELQSDIFPLRYILENLVRSMSVMADKKGISLALEASPDIPEFVLGDSGRLTQVLNNLLMNAIKFTDEGSVRLVAFPCEVTVDDVCISFSVTDTGIGISEKDREYIFNAFSQADNSTMRRFKGTGLGLTISLRLVEMMQGTLEVESREGEGSTFSFKAHFGLPDRESASEASAQFRGEPLELMNDENFRRLKILLVEDNVINQKVALKMLSNVGHSVKVADNGQEAIDKFRKEKFDLILMDIEMPLVDGYEATRVIREMEAEHSRTPIIAMTAHAFERDCKRCLDIGMNDYISKPVNTRKLIKIINNAVK